MMTTWKYMGLGGSACLVLVMAGVALGTLLRQGEPLPPQPIAFNHRLHMEQAQGIECEDCHRFVTRQTYAGLPSKAICFECHDPRPDQSDTEADARQPRFAILMSFRDSDQDIPWHRVTALRPDVFFSHRLHVTVAGLDCRECHATIVDSTRPPTRGPEQMEMETCLRCHEEQDATDDCVSCHR